MAMGEAPELVLASAEDMATTNDQKNGDATGRGLQQVDELTEDNQGCVEESEMQRALEVVFENSGMKRRKASMAYEPDHHDKPERPPMGRGLSSCYVHQHLGSAPPIDENELSAEGISAERACDKDPEGQITNGDEKKHHDKDNAVDSRLLTKKQLSDMAYGIRELSKKLSHIQLRLKVRNVFILAKAHDRKLVKYSRELTDWLLTKDDGRYSVYVEDKMKEDKTFNAEGLLKKNPNFEDRLRYWDNELCARKPHAFDIVIALGGDGTVLYASWLFQKIVPPVLSFALGSLGFLTKFDFQSYPQILSRAFLEGITVSLRLRFEATVMRCQRRDGHCDADHTSRDIVEELIGEESEDHHTHKPIGRHNILNEVVIDRGPNPTMSTLEVFGDNEHFTTVQADGICIATPTGSTAYNLAAGGSLCHPDNPVILLTAICAHTLSFRPIVLPDTLVLRIGVPYDARTHSWASFDGRERVELMPGDYVTVSASRYPFACVLPGERKREDWIDSISRTLNWNSRQRQKGFDDDGMPKSGKGFNQMA